MDPEDETGVIEDGPEHGRDDDLDIANAGDFSHDKSPGPHDRRHEHPAGGGRGLHRPGELLAVAQVFHERDGEGPGGVDIGCSHTADGTEQPAADHRDLGRASGTFAGQSTGQVREKLPGAGVFHKGPEDDEQSHERGGDPGNGAIDSGIGDQVLHLDDLREDRRFRIKYPRQIGGDVQVGKKSRDQDGHGRHYGSSDPFQKQDDVESAQSHFQGQDRIDEDQAHAQGVVVNDHIERGQQGQAGQEQVRNRGAVFGRMSPGRKEQKGHRQEKEHVDAPLDPGLHNAEGGGVEMKKGHNNEAGANGPGLPPFQLPHGLTPDFVYPLASWKVEV